MRGRENTHDQMRQRLLAFGDDFWIEDEQGHKAFKVDSKAARVRQTLQNRREDRLICFQVDDIVRALVMQAGLSDDRVATVKKW